MFKKLSFVLAFLLLFSVTPVMAQDYCDADADGNLKVDLSDLVIMREEFLRTDCPPCDSIFLTEADLDHLNASDGSPANAVYVDADGNVGIGMFPYSTLSVGGSGIYAVSNNIGVSGYGTLYGGLFVNSDTSGSDYGLSGQAQGIGGAQHYGGYFYATGATDNIGVLGSGSTKGVIGTATECGVQGIGEIGISGNGTTYGGIFENYDTSGDDYGTYGLATGSGGTTHYGGYFDANGATGDNIGVFGKGTTHGGYFSNTDTNDVDYGAYSVADGVGGNAHYGGYFEASGAAVNYGVAGHSSQYGVFGSGNTGVYGIGYYDGVGVMGTSAYRGGLFRSESTTGVGYAVQGEANLIGGTTHYGGYFLASGASTNYGVRASGTQYDFYADGPGTDYGTSSSIRWKQNIFEIDNALNKVLNLRGVYFDWDIEHGGQHDMGMIAEEVGKIVPEVVQYEPDSVYADGMDYGALTPLLVQAIKEQNKIVKELKQQNNQLKQLVCLDHPDAEVCAQ